MAVKKGLLFALVLVVFIDLLTEGKSIRKLRSKTQVYSIKKRSSSYYIWQDTCPPPDYPTFPDVQCVDTCHSDDDCLGNLLCCDNGCKMCMEPVLPPPVIDWLGSPLTYHRGFAEGSPDNNNIKIDLNPHVEEKVCAYSGKTFTIGETFLKGCHKCQCTNKGINCDVGPCKIDKNTNEEKHSGESSGEDILRIHPVEALAVDNRLIELPTDIDLGNARFESLGEGKTEVRLIPSVLERKIPSGNGDDIDYSGEEEIEEHGERQQLKLKEEIDHSGEEEMEEHSVGQQPKSREDIEHTGLEGIEEFNVKEQENSGENIDHSGHEEMDELNTIEQPMFRRILRKETGKKDPEIRKNVLII